MSKSPSRIEPRRLNKFQTYLLRPSVRLSVHTYEIDFLNKLDMSKSPSRIGPIKNFLKVEFQSDDINK